MKVSSDSNTLASQYAKSSANSIKTNFTEKISQEEAMELKAQIMENANAYVLKSINPQGTLGAQKISIDEGRDDFQSFLKDIGYEGKSITELSQEEAAKLVGEDGIFGISQTSQRIADFVINGAGGDEAKLKAGREGMLQGFKMAEEMWGGELPEISQKTMQAATEMVDKAAYDLGFSLINTEA